MNLNTPAERIAALRAAMKAAHLDAWIAPSADPHLSEYIPEHWQTRRWLSGFDGSVPTLIITADRAELWADSRYWEQATQQLAGSGVVLQKLGFGKTHIDSLAEHLAPRPLARPPAAATSARLPARPGVHQRADRRQTRPRPRRHARTRRDAPPHLQPG